MEGQARSLLPPWKLQNRGGSDRQGALAHRKLELSQYGAYSRRHRAYGYNAGALDAEGELLGVYQGHSVRPLDPWSNRCRRIQ